MTKTKKDTRDTPTNPVTEFDPDVTRDDGRDHFRQLLPVTLKVTRDII